MKQQPEVSVGAAPDRSCDTPPGRRTLLVVDDEEGPRETLRLVFEGEYNVLLAESGRQALQLARRQRVDAAVLDLRMAGMSGIELLGKLKTIDAHMEVIILTAYAALETARQAMRYGACDYLTKPFELEAIRSAVASMMTRRMLAEETQASLARLQVLDKEFRKLREREELLQNRSEIYGSVLHDINKPLTVIGTTLAVLNRRLGDLSCLEGHSMAEFRDRLRTLNRQADSISEVIHRYLSLLRRRQNEECSVSVNSVLTDLRELLKVYPKARDGHASFVLLSEDLEVRANPIDLLQILLNVTLNALQAGNEAHTVEVSAASEAQAPPFANPSNGARTRTLVSEEFAPEGPVVAITVKDRGHGIPPEVVAKLFDTPVTTKPAKLGTGLGLTIVKRLVLASRAALCLETEPGVGTLATLYLEASRPPNPHRAEATDALRLPE